MPTIEDRLPSIARKNPDRKFSQSAVAFTYAKAAFFHQALPKLQRAIRMTDERLRVLHKAQQPQDDVICKLNASLCNLIELERSLLGFPSPGRRRDTDAIPVQPVQSHSQVATVVESAPEPAPDPGQPS